MIGPPTLRRHVGHLRNGNAINWNVIGYGTGNKAFDLNFNAAAF